MYNKQYPTSCSYGEYSCMSRCKVPTQYRNMINAERKLVSDNNDKMLANYCYITEGQDNTSSLSMIVLNSRD